MREILFRGKTHGDEDEPGEWIYGDLETHVKDQMRIVCQVKQTSENSLYFSSMVIPETVGQFTGFHDYNEKRIFEGDIAKCITQCDEEGIGEIVFSEGRWVVDYQVGNFNSEFLSLYLELEEYNRYSFQVIGNIHENPELLELSDQKVPESES